MLSPPSNFSTLSSNYFFKPISILICYLSNFQLNLHKNPNVKSNLLLSPEAAHIFASPDESGGKAGVAATSLDQEQAEDTNAINNNVSISSETDIEITLTGALDITTGTVCGHPVAGVGPPNHGTCSEDEREGGLFDPQDNFFLIFFQHYLRSWQQREDNNKYQHKDRRKICQRSILVGCQCRRRQNHLRRVAGGPLRWVH